MAWGAVTAPRIRRGPAQRGHTRTSSANTRRERDAHGSRPGQRERAESAGRATSGAACGGTNEASRSSNSIGSKSNAVEPSRSGRRNW